MTGKFYVVGVGPGDPDLLTIKSIKIIEESSVLIVPKGHEDGNSTALSIISQAIDLTGKELIEIHFPMKKIRMSEKPDPEVEAAWEMAADKILARIEQGKIVSFPTIGDPAIYSTGFYTCQTLLNKNPDVKTQIIPGVSSIGACSATAGVPLCQGDDMMAVIPATFDNEKLTEIFSTFQTIVLMKVHRVLPRIKLLLDELNLIDRSILIERTSQNTEKIYRDIRTLEPDDLHYFSTMIVRAR